MNPYGTHSKYTCAICIYVILSISAVLFALLAVKNIKISPDSMIYALVSQEIIAGNGISLPIIYDLGDNHDFINGTIPYVGGPPLLPILYAILGGVTPQSFLPAKIINVISHVAVSIFALLLMKELYNKKSIALLTAILVSISYPLLWDSHYMITESLFIALTVAMLYFMVLSRHSYSSQSIGYHLIASICASAAILTRFAGIALIPVFFWGTYILVKNKNIKLMHVPAVFATMLPLITAASLFIITYSISGSTHGWETPSPGRSYFDAFTGTIKMMFLQFDLTERSIAVISVVMILFILYIVLNSDARRGLLTYFHSGLDLMIVLIISYTALITHAMAKAQTVFELRYMHPLAPILFILSILSVVVVWEIIRTKGYFRLSLFVLLLSLGIITFVDCYKTYMKSEEIFSEDLGHYRILNSPTYHWIKDNYGKNVIITTNRPFHLSFFGGYSTIRLPHKRFEKNTLIPDNIESYLPNRMSKFGSRVLALFEQADEQYEGSYVAGLFNKRENDDHFVLMHEFSDGVVYQIKE